MNISQYTKYTQRIHYILLKKFIKYTMNHVLLDLVGDNLVDYCINISKPRPSLTGVDRAQSLSTNNSF